MRGFFSLLRRETIRFFHVPNNTILPVLVSTILYFVIFGVALGERIGAGDQEAYLAFLIPGLIMMNLINGSFSNPSGSLYVSRLLGYINDVLLSSLSHKQIVAAYILSGVIRGFVLALATWAVGLIFVFVGVHNLAVLLIYSFLTAIVFACLGIITGLVAERNDTLNIPRNFVITPLVFLGGVFYSIEIIPETLQFVTIYNPIFYMVNGLRYSMTGVSEASILFGILLLTTLAVVLVGVVTYLFRIGWKLRS
ncbi:MAG: ABC transporter permease [Candidatus Woesearchaeota archaeon]